MTSGEKQPEPATRSRWWPAAIIALAAGLAYANTFDVPFLLDDEGQIETNPYVRQLTSPRVLVDTTRPLTRLSFALNYAWHRLDVTGYHVVNLALHVLAAWALFGLVRRTLQGRGIPAGLQQQSTPIALVAALVWALHPLNTAAVTYISQRAEVLMAACYLGCLYAVNRGAASAQHARRWYVAAVLLCLLGMASKEVIVTAPVLILLYDRVFLAASWSETFRKRVWLYAGLALSWALLPLLWWWAPKLFGTVGTGTSVSVWQYLASQPTVILHYLKLVVWPQPLVFDYAWEPISDVGQIVLTGTLVLALLITTGFALAKWPRAGFAVFAFWILLAPTSSFVPVQDLIVEHRMYLPLAALATGLVVAGFVLVEKFAGERAAVVGTAMAAVLICALGFRTWQRNSDYASEVSIWAHTVKFNETNFRAQTNLAKALSSTYPQDLDAALLHAKLAVEYSRARQGADNPYPPALNTLGTIHDLRFEFQQAMTCYIEAAARFPNDPAGRNNLANAWLRVGALDAALENFSKAVQLQPNLAEPHYNYGAALLRKGNFDQAVTEFREALRLYNLGLYMKPLHVELRCNLGHALLATGQLDEAEEHLRAALQIRKAYPQALHGLGSLLVHRGRFDEGIELLKQSIQINPDYYPSYYLLKGVYQSTGKRGEAIKVMQALIEKNPFHSDALTELGVLYILNAQPRRAVDTFREALRHDKGQLDARIEMAWLLSTHVDSAIRNGKAAVALLEPTCTRKDLQDANQWPPRAARAWDALAAAYAETGKFDQAVEACDKAIEIATDDELQHEIQVRQQLYQAGLPYRDPQRVATRPGP